MEIFFGILAKIVAVYLSVVSLAMLLRVILQFFVPEDHKLVLMCHVVSEPVIMPFRFLFYKMNIGQNSPFDLPFLAAYFAIFILELILPVI